MKIFLIIFNKIFFVGYNFFIKDIFNKIFYYYIIGTKYMYLAVKKFDW